MKRYEKYKDSKVAWLGQIPEHWGRERIKHCFDERVQKGYPDEPLLSATQSHGVIPQSLYANRVVTAQKDLHLLKLVEQGDFVISLRSFQGGIEYAYYRGIISPAYTVMIPNSVTAGYFKYLAKSLDFIGLLQTCVTGIREGQNIDYKILKNKRIPIPSVAEQEQIVRYLDWKVAMADKFVREKRREITLLKELRQAEINRAVTRGLDHTAPTKPSGIGWIGDIPEHWQCMALKRLFVDRQSGAWGEEQKNEDGDRICLRIADFNYDILRFKRVDEYTIRNYSIDLINRLSLKKGDILIEKSGGGEKTPVGRAVIFDLDINEAMYANFMDRLKVQKGNDSLFIVYLLNCLYKNGVMWNYIKQTTGIQNLDLSNLLSKESIVKPPIIEQQQIVEHIKTIEANINKAIEKIENEIILTVEYKTRLISDVTTGKVDVRGIEIPKYTIEEAIIPDNEEIDEQL